MSILHRWKEIQDWLHNNDIPIPHFVDFHTSYACNHHCIGCAYAGRHTGYTLSKDKHFEIVDMFIDVGVKAFDFAGGGEPTILPYLLPLLKRIKKRGAYFGLITNGSLLTDELIDFLSENATYVRISLEASDKELYVRYKGVGEEMWNRVLRNAKKLADTGIKDFSLKFSVSKTLRGSLFYMNAIELAKSLGVRKITFKSLRHAPEELSLQDKKIEDRILRNVLKFYDGIETNIWIVPVSKKDVPQCTLNVFHTVIDAMGDMFICCYYYYRGEEMLLGNLFNDNRSVYKNFVDIWFSKEHIDKIRKIDRNKCAVVDCKFFRHHKLVEDTIKYGTTFLL